MQGHLPHQGDQGLSPARGRRPPSSSRFDAIFAVSPIAVILEIGSDMFKESSGFVASHIAAENEKRDLCFYFEVVRFCSRSTGISDNTFVWGTELFRDTVKSKVCLLILFDKRERHVLAIGTGSSRQISPFNIAYLCICGTRHLDKICAW